jgi:enoyl-CoA hydratase
MTMQTEIGDLMSLDNLRVEVDDGIAVVTIDNPPVNAVHRAVFRELIEVFSSFDGRDDVRAVIFTGAGRKAFVAGADINKLEPDRLDVLDGPPGDRVDPGRRPRRAIEAIRTCAVPVIAAVNGPAVGGGAVYASVCDMIVAADHAKFSIAELNVGLLGAGRHLQRMLGTHTTRYMYFTAEPVPAAEMMRLGAIQAVVPLEDLLPTARAIAEKIARKSPIAVRLAKIALNRTEFMPVDSGYEVEQDLTARLGTYEDSAEAQRAFIEKREPAFQWR